MKPLIILAGATAVGKTSLSVELAKAINGEIISADSMQVYRYMDIGTAKIREEEMDGIPHYLIDEFMPDEDFNVTIFKERAEKYIDRIIEKGKIPIIVGGTGFYIQAVLYDIDFTEHNEDIDEDGHERTFRDHLYRRLEEEGKEALYNELTEIDPEYAAIIHMNNSKKVIRALEYFHLTGKKMSMHNVEQRNNSSPYNYIYFVINDERDKIYDRINKRVDDMLAEGLTDEVRGLLERGYGRELVSMQGIGYKEIAGCLEGEYSLLEAAEMIKKGTRHYARRQMTWFKRERNTTYININEFNTKEQIIEYMAGKIKEQLRNEDEHGHNL